TVTFPLDVDPPSIRGASAPGPGESGSVSGLELTGASVTVTYEDGTSQTSSLFRNAGSLGQAQIRLDGTSRPTPSLAVVGIASTPATVSQLNHVIRVSGTPGAS